MTKNISDIPDRINDIPSIRNIYCKPIVLYAIAPITGPRIFIKDPTELKIELALGVFFSPTMLGIYVLIANQKKD
jgi:hypothetical protein